MQVIITDIIDKNAIKNEVGTKALLMDNLVEFFAPLFYEDIRNKQGQLANNRSDIEKLQKIIKANREKLISLNKQIELESVRQRILQEIEYLNDIDVLYGKNKMIVRNIISNLNVKNDGALKKNLSILQRMTKEKVRHKRG